MERAEGRALTRQRPKGKRSSVFSRELQEEF